MIKCYKYNNQNDFDVFENHLYSNPERNITFDFANDKVTIDAVNYRLSTIIISDDIQDLVLAGGSDYTKGYEIANEDVAGSPEYYGFVNSSGNWYILKVNAGAYTYTRGNTVFSTNWTGRAGLTYSTFDALDWTV